MDLKRLRTFVTVAEQGTVSKAALALRITQPALSRQIGDLQQDLGLKLFRRSGRCLVLTREGEQLLGDCRTVLSIADSLSERAQLLRQGDTGVLRVAAAPQTIESVLPSFLHRYAERYPGVRVKLVEALASDHLAMLERGEVHLGDQRVPGKRRALRGLPIAAARSAGSGEPAAAARPGLGRRADPHRGAPAPAHLGLRDPPAVGGRLPAGPPRAGRVRRKQCATFAARAGSRRTRRGGHSLDRAGGTPGPMGRPRRV